MSEKIILSRLLWREDVVTLLHDTMSKMVFREHKNNTTRNRVENINGKRKKKYRVNIMPEKSIRKTGTRRKMKNTEKREIHTIRGRNHPAEEETAG